MCGIAGIFAPAGEPIPEAMLRRMTAALAHRGPDGDGFHIEPGIGLGHRRLAILDLGGGRQPMYNEDGTVAVVFNGEIYNHAELRDELRALGHVFRTRSDTEAIVHAWESWGPRCVERLAGMFALVLWDARQRQLFLARDRVGKKPLYYTRLTDGTLLFGSELCALFAHPRVSRRLSPAAIDDFFAFGYVPDPECIYADIRKLPAAHWLLLAGGEGGSAGPQCYWRPRFAPQRCEARIAAEELRERLARSVATRLVADVPLGAFLSGGVDSSAVVATMGRLGADPIATFTIGFDGADDETGFAADIARRYATAQHVERQPTLDYIDAADEQAAIFGEPFADSSSVPTLRVCHMARRHVTVALSGDGGDEVFGGYRRYRWHCLAEAVRAYLPAPVRHRLFGELARLYPKLDRAPRWLRAKSTLSEISLDSALGYYRTVCQHHDDARRRLFAPALRRAIDGHRPADRIAAAMEEADSDDPLSQAQYADLKTFLVGDILTKVDRASMAVSLEVRAPLLDHDLIEWAMTLPPALKLHRGDGKYVLKRAIEDRVPAANLYRRKQGFATSLAAQFRGPGGERIIEKLLSGAMADARLFDPGEIRRLIDRHRGGGTDHSAVLWSLLAFAEFLAHHDRAAAPPAAPRRAVA